MKRIYQLVIVLGFAGVPFLANAADVDDVTMQVMEHSDKPDAVTKEIELPDEASDMAKDKAEHGLTQANDSKQQGEDKDHAQELEHEMENEHEQEHAQEQDRESAAEQEQGSNAQEK